jgi:hypothetical protein
VNAGTVTVTTDANGNVTITSGRYGSATNSNYTYASRIRFQVTSVTKSGLTWTTNSSTKEVTNPG